MIPFKCIQCSCDHEDSIAFVHRCQRRKSYCLTKKSFCFANGKGSPGDGLCATKQKESDSELYI